MRCSGGKQRSRKCLPRREHGANVRVSREIQPQGRREQETLRSRHYWPRTHDLTLGYTTARWCTQNGLSLRQKQRSSDRTHDTIALAYIGEIRQTWRGVTGVKMDAPTKVSKPSYDYWRLDFSAPDQVPRYNSAIVITLSDRRILVVRAGAPSQSELDSEVDSLARMRFDKSQKE